MSDNSNMGSDRSTVDTKLGCNGEVWKLLNMAQNLNGRRELSGVSEASCLRLSHSLN